MSAPRARTTAKRTRSRDSGQRRRSGGPARSNRFKKTVLEFYKKHGRHGLPWRKTRDPYRILVSEIMLQQTQVERVVPFYSAFLKKFPTARSLANAPLTNVLRLWQGLGYNRRAKMLHEAAKKIVLLHKGAVPREYGALRALPGVGEYTAKAVRTFVWNESDILLETNIRSAFLHHFFSKRTNISDDEIISYMIRFQRFNGKNHETETPREWYWALMDYGSYLKRAFPNPSRKSAHHAKQKPFKGSDREIRGAILRAHLKGENLAKLPFTATRIKKQRAALMREGLI